MFEAACLGGPVGRGWGTGHGRQGLGTGGLPSLDTGKPLEGREQIREATTLLYEDCHYHRAPFPLNHWPLKAGYALGL